MWSVGVILFLLLSGSPPFVDDNQSELFRKIRTAEWKFRGNEWNNVSKEAKDLIKRLLVPNPLQRITAAQALRCRWFRSKDNNAVRNKNSFPEAVSPSIKPELQTIANETDWADSANGLQAVEQVLNRREAEELKLVNESIPHNSIRRGDELNGKIESSKVLKTKSRGAEDVKVRVESNDDSTLTKGVNAYDQSVSKISGKDYGANEADDPAISSSNPAKALIPGESHRIQNRRPENSVPNVGAAERIQQQTSNLQDQSKIKNSPRSPVKPKTDGSDLQHKQGATNRMQRGEHVSKLPVAINTNRLQGTNVPSSVTNSKSAVNVRSIPERGNAVPGGKGQLDTVGISHTSTSVDNLVRPSQKRLSESTKSSRTSDRIHRIGPVKRIEAVSNSLEPNDVGPRMLGICPLSVDASVKDDGVAFVTNAQADSGVRPKRLSGTTKTNEKPDGVRNAAVSNVATLNVRSSLQASKFIPDAASGKSAPVVVRRPQDFQHIVDNNVLAVHTNISTNKNVSSSNNPALEQNEASRSASRVRYQDVSNSGETRHIVYANDLVNRPKVQAAESKSVEPNGGSFEVNFGTRRQNVPAVDSGLHKLVQHPAKNDGAYAVATTEHIAPQVKRMAESITKPKPRHTSEQPSTPRSERIRLQRLSRLSKENGEVQEFERLEI
jgi:serine/threonine protein kinase